MRNLIGRWTSISLIGRIVVCLIIGGALGFMVPGNDIIPILGNLFVGALKAVAPLLVFFLVASALANAKGAGSMKTVIIMYLISTLVAALIAVLMSAIFPLTVTLVTDASAEVTSPDGIGAVFMNLLNNLIANPVQALADGNYLGILAWGLVLGVALRAATDSTKHVFSDVSDAVTKVVKGVIQFAPIGILGLVYSSVSTAGAEIFTEYGQLVLLLVGCMLIAALITNPLLVFAMTRRNPFPLVFTCLRDSGITAFFTRSSAANIPVNMELCHRMGLNKDNYSVSIPLGATINMAGAAITITVMTQAAAHTLGIQTDIPTAIILSVLAAVSATGASGVAGGSLMLIPLACSLYGIGGDVAMQVVAIGFIVGVIQDSCETGLNSSSDVLFTAAAELRERRLSGSTDYVNLASK